MTSNTIQEHEVYEKTRLRIKQKKRLYFHFILFLVGSVFFVILNKVLKFREDQDWFLWAIFAWLFVLIIHFLNVFIMKRFFGTDWERVETEKLIQKHDKKVEKLENKLDKQGVINKDNSTETL